MTLKIDLWDVEDDAKNPEGGVDCSYRCLTVA